MTNRQPVQITANSYTPQKERYLIKEGQFLRSKGHEYPRVSRHGKQEPRGACDPELGVQRRRVSLCWPNACAGSLCAVRRDVRFGYNEAAWRALPLRRLPYQCGPLMMIPRRYTARRTLTSSLKRLKAIYRRTVASLI